MIFFLNKILYKIYKLVVSIDLPALESLDCNSGAQQANNPLASPQKQASKKR